MRYSTEAINWRFLCIPIFRTRVALPYIWRELRRRLMELHPFARGGFAAARPLLCAGALLWCSHAAAQISPGSLSPAHAQLEGVTKCTSCHESGSSGRGFKCLECHGEIRRRVEANTGYHARVYKTSASQTDCARCHAEHNGPKFVLTRLDRKSFDHRAQTGFVLEGKHREQSCQGCHSAKRVPAASRKEIKLTDADKSFLGLGRECTSCHQDPHAGQLGLECVRCHSQDAWTPAPGFNHGRTAFPLTGLHPAVPCQKCHAQRQAETAARYKGVPFSGCQSCHKDPHRGAFADSKFAGGCDTCHTTSGWKNNRPSANFHHNDTKFPLHGKHAETACTQCHKDSDYRRPVPHERCQTCHQDDPHKGQFVARAAGSDCGACHSETSFKPSLFSRETHQRSAFPLEQKHAPLECAKCHQPEGRQAVYLTGKLTCNACHPDAHGGEFATAPWANKCEACHTQTGFQPSTFSVVRHSQTRYDLTGKHAAVACNDCHKPLASAPSIPAASYVPRQYHFASQTCVACHADPHQTMLACEACHTTQQWKELRNFDHSTTKFLTEGPHNIACIRCHRASDAPASKTASKETPLFSKTPNQCFGCHRDVHGGQFMGGGPREDCSACHVLPRWSATDFNHDQTRFPIDRAHRNVGCVQCHKEQKETDGKTIRIYRGTPTECTKCH